MAGEKTYGWVGKVLRVDLSRERLWEVETTRYAGEYLGGRGAAARVAWEELRPGVDAFDAENRLIFMTGPLTGTLAPSSGRVEVCGVSAQTYPGAHYTRSCMGGHWPSELKYAGYDGVVVQGKASSPVMLWVEDGDARLEGADRLWGLDTFEAQVGIKRERGRDVESVCIGPAGENLVRIAVVQGGLENAAGQGGFGAVMGSKNLKAIAVRGSGSVRVARPGALMEAAEHVRRVAYVSGSGCEAPRAHPPRGEEPLSKSCTLSCRSHCLQVHRTGKGEVVGVQCCSGSYLSLKPPGEPLEVALKANQLGLNHWEVVNGFRGAQGWLPKCWKAGVFTDAEFDLPFQPETAEFWSELVRRIAFREGIGDVLAEGWARAADLLGKGREWLPHVAHGFQSHWDGHLYGAPRWPYWLVSALTWVMDSRDPLVHGYASRLTSMQDRFEDPSKRAGLLEVSRRVYGSERAVDPEAGYEWKAQPTVWNQDRDAVKDSLILCDVVYPLHFTPQTETGYGDTGVEARLFSATTGVDLDEAALDRVGERIVNLERAIMVREGRTRAVDEVLADYFRKPDYQGVQMDWGRFKALLDEYYTLRGWDVKTGWPTREKLEELGMRDVADELEGLMR